MNWEGGMSLGEIIQELKKHDKSKHLNIGLYKPGSYRGYYECLMFEPKHNSTVGESLKSCQEANGKTYTGYKGGEYIMTTDTECYFAEYGATGVAITKPILHGILNNFYEFDDFIIMFY